MRCLISSSNAFSLSSCLHVSFGIQCHYLWKAVELYYTRLLATFILKSHVYHRSSNCKNIWKLFGVILNTGFDVFLYLRYGFTYRLWFFFGGVTTHGSCTPGLQEIPFEFLMNFLWHFMIFFCMFKKSLCIFYAFLMQFFAFLMQLFCISYALLMPSYAVLMQFKKLHTLLPKLHTLLPKTYEVVKTAEKLHKKCIRIA